MRIILTSLGGTAVTAEDRLAREAFGGGRLTSQRSAIAHAARSLNGAFTVEDLSRSVRERLPSAGATATVYRAVAAMEASGFIERVGTRDGAQLFARCSADEHHHHVVCLGCGRIGHTDCPLETAAPAPARSDGFVVTRHEVTLYGYCGTCSRSNGGD